jgi:polar amino acid transport system substrate-binding protein
MRRIVVVRFFVLALLCLKLAHAAEPVKITIGTWCPYVCNDKSRPGILVEISTAAFAARGLSTVYINQPWQRELATTRRGHVDAVLGIARADAPDLLFPKRSIGHFKPCFYVRSTSTWTYRDVESLKQIRLSVLQGETFGTLVDQYLSGEGSRNGLVDFLSGDQYLAQHFRKVLIGRDDAALEDERVISNFLRETNQTERFRKAGCLEQEEVWIAFAPFGKNSATYLSAFEQGLDTIIKTGRFKAILDKYGLDVQSF